MVYSSCIRFKLRSARSSTPAAAIRFELGCKQIWAVDGEERLTFLHIVANSGEKGDDFALIRREDLILHVFIEVDAADGFFFSGKFALGHRLDLHSGELRI